MKSQIKEQSNRTVRPLKGKKLFALFAVAIMIATAFVGISFVSLTNEDSSAASTQTVNLSWTVGTAVNYDTGLEDGNNTGYNKSSGTMPTGVSFTTSGGTVHFTGTPTKADTFTVTFKKQNYGTSNWITSADTYVFSINVAASSSSPNNTSVINLVKGQTYRYSPTFNISSPTITVSANGSSQPGSSANYSSTSGYASVSNGVIDVTVPASYSGNNYYVTIKAVTSNPTQTVYQNIKFAIVDAFAVSGNASAIGVVGNGFTYIPSTTSGWTISSWSISPSLPSGLSFNASTGVISGTPSAVSNATTYTLTATTVQPSVTATKTVSIKIEPALVVTAPANVYAVENGNYDPVAFSVTNGVSGVSYQVTSITGGLSTSKVSIDNNGSISVAASSGDAGTYTVTVTVTSDNQEPVTKTFALTIVQALGFTSTPVSGFYVVG
ncbi:MAG: putative Ig domain-containing protein [Candidatus Methanomethylophilaceae archaeon]|nr:putative Ig domain-containing protein [Candidatus Methanomethylophilaceae archaeon]